MRGAIPVGAAVLALLLQGCVNPAPAQNIRIKDNDVGGRGEGVLS